MAYLISSPTSKGQVTIPAKIRSKFGIDPKSLLQFSEENGKIVITPLKIQKSVLREYSKREIDNFLETDKLSKSDANFFNKILND